MVFVLRVGPTSHYCSHADSLSLWTHHAALTVWTHQVEFVTGTLPWMNERSDKAKIKSMKLALTEQIVASPGGLK